MPPGWEKKCAAQSMKTGRRLRRHEFLTARYNFIILPPRPRLYIGCILQYIYICIYIRRRLRISRSTDPLSFSALPLFCHFPVRSHCRRTSRAEFSPLCSLFVRSEAKWFWPLYTMRTAFVVCLLKLIRKVGNTKFS